MALTINQQPSNTLFVPVNNPIEYLVNSTNTAQPNFKLSCKIIVGGAEQIELKYDVIPGTAFVISEIQRLLEGYLEENSSTNLFLASGQSKVETAMKKDCRAVFQEWYSSASSALPTYQGTQSSGNVFYIWNGAFKYREWQANEWQQYTIDGTPASDEFNKFLTPFGNRKTNFTIGSGYNAITNLSSADKFKKITPTQLSRLVWQCNGINGSFGFYIYFNFYNSNFQVLSPQEAAAADQLNSSTYIPNVVNGFNVFSKNFSIDLIKTAGNWSYFNNNLAGITSANIKYISVYCKSPTIIGSEALLYEIDWNACSQYDTYEIHWLNHLGGWDSWVFDKNSSKQIPVTRSFYSQPVTRRISSNTIIHDSYARKKRQFHTNISERFTINSGMLLDWEYDGLIDLLQSPLVYWRHPDYGFIAINIMEQDVIQVPRQITDKAYNLSFVFEINNNDKLQGL